MCRCGKILILAWMVAATSLAALFPLATAARAAEEVAPTIRLDDATFFGLYNNITGTNRFAGIPFAKPPTGDLRFRLPVPNDPYALGTVNATTFGPSCTQDNAPYNIPDNLAPAAKAILESANSNLVDSEDCLTINVWQPDGVTKDSKLPVVVWIYGGGFTGGGTVSYDGSFIVQRSVALNQPIIYVSMNYRLAAFGFLGGAEVKEAGVANLGLQDQRQAFKWVRKYISAFGGDPDKVTIWGESAGAISVALHMIANRGDNEGLFRAGFMQSGSPIPFGTVEQGQQSYDHLVESVDCQNSTNSLQCLRNVPYEALKAALNSSASNSSDSSWAPRADGRFLVDPPQHAVLKGTVANIPFVTGDCDDEGTLFVLSATNVTTNNDTRKYIANNYLPTAPLEDIDQLLVLYPDDITQGSPFDTGNENALTPEYKRLAAFHGDAIFVGPRRFILQQRSDKQPTWSFLSKRSKSLPDLGSYHGHDLVNIYGDGELTDYLVDFVNRLDPNGNGTGSQTQWPRYTTSNPLLMTFLDGTIPQEITQDTFRKDAIGNVTEIFLKYPL